MEIQEIPGMHSCKTAVSNAAEGGFHKHPGKVTCPCVVPDPLSAMATNHTDAWTGIFWRRHVFSVREVFLWKPL